MPTDTPYQFIAIARTIARGFTEQASRPPRWGSTDRGRAGDLARDRAS